MSFKRILMNEGKKIWTHTTGFARCYILKTQNSNLGKFWKALQWKMLVYLMAILFILLPFCSFYGHFVHFMAILSILRPNSIFYGQLVYFSPFGYVVGTETNLATHSHDSNKKWTSSDVAWSKI
jgi:hypothetical protein